MIIAAEYFFDKTKKKILESVKKSVEEYKKRHPKENRYKIVDYVRNKLEEQNFTLYDTKSVFVDDHL